MKCGVDEAEQAERERVLLAGEKEQSLCDEGNELKGKSKRKTSKRKRGRTRRVT